MTKILSQGLIRLWRKMIKTWLLRLLRSAPYYGAPLAVTRVDLVIARAPERSEGGPKQSPWDLVQLSNVFIRLACAANAAQ